MRCSTHSRRPVFRLADRRLARLIALFLAIASPAPLIAQEAPAAVAAYADWVPYERFGIVFRAPPGMRVGDDVATPERMEFSVLDIGDDGIGTRMGMKVITPAEAAELPARPGDDGFAAMLSEMVPVAIVRTEVVLVLGGIPFRAYSGTGTVTKPDGTVVDARMTFLVNQQPLPSGHDLWIAIYSAGRGDDAARIEADFVASLQIADAAAVGVFADAPADGDAADDADAGSGDAVAADTDAGPDAAEPEARPEPVLPAATGSLPEGWVAHRRFGLTLGAPEGMAIERDIAVYDEMEFAVEREDADAGQLDAIGMRVMTGEGVAGLGSAPGSEAFAEMLAQWSDLDVRRSEQTVTLGDLVLRAYFGTGTRPVAGEDRDALILYLISEAPSANGTWPFVVIATAGYERARAEAQIAQAVAALAVDDASQLGRAAEVRVLGGLATLAVPGGQVVADVSDGSVTALIGLAAVETPGRIDAALGVIRNEDPIGFLRGEFVRIDGISDTVLDGMPALLVAGASRMAPDRTALPEGGGDVGLYAVVPGICPQPGQALVVGALVRDPALSSVLLESVSLALSADAVACPELLGAVRAALTSPPADDPAQPPSDPVTPPASGQVTVTPGTGDSKDPATAVDVPDPDTAEWSAALASDDPGAVIGYLTARPDGRHADEARAWLQARAIMPPDSPAPAPGSWLESDAVAWGMAAAEGSAEAMWTYLKAWPFGAHADQARAILAGGPPIPPQQAGK